MPYDPAIPLLSMYLEKTLIQKDAWTPVFIATLITIAKTCVSVSVCESLSHVQLFSTLWTVAHQASLHEILHARILEWIAIPSSSQDREAASMLINRWIFFLLFLLSCSWFTMLYYFFFLLTTGNIENLYIHLLAICMSFSENVYSVPLPILIRLLFFLLSCLSSLHSLAINPL